MTTIGLAIELMHLLLRWIAGKGLVIAPKAWFSPPHILRENLNAEQSPTVTSTAATNILQIGFSLSVFQQYNSSTLIDTERMFALIDQVLCPQ